MWDLDLSTDGLKTPFRAHLEHCRSLDLRAQLEECADYIQHIDVLVTEFLESYYLVERLWEPGTRLDGADDSGELVLEPFYQSLELELDSGDGLDEVMVCVSGAVRPLPGGQHAAISRGGLDYVGVRRGIPPLLVLGVVEASKDETPFLLLLRALNGFAELSPPLRVAQIGQELVREGIPEDAKFGLQIGVDTQGAELEGAAATDATALGELTRDLAEAFLRRASQDRQLSDTLAEIGCVEVDEASLAAKRLRRLWRV